MDCRRWRHILLIIMLISHAYGFIKSTESFLPRAPVLEKHATLESSGCKEVILKKTASCNHEGLEFVPNDLRADIQELKMEENKIQSLSNSSFSRYSLLSRLYLSHNLIRAIETETFKQLTLLTHLDLSYNRNLHRINAEMFKWSSELWYLDLENTGLFHFPENFLKWLPNLGDLDLQRNNLTSIHFKSCPNPYANTSVDLSFNQISALTPQTISINCDFKDVYLKGNPVLLVNPNSLSNLHIGSVSLGSETMTVDSWSKAFAGLSQSEITSLTIYPTGISYIPQTFFNSFRNDHSPSFMHIHSKSVDGVHPLAFRNLSSVYELSIILANITTIKPNYFNGMKQLQMLHLDNGIEFIKPSRTSWDNLNMYHLDLSWNKLRQIKPYAFRGLTALMILDLGTNTRLTVVEITSFSGLNHLQILVLSFTNIAKIVMEVPPLECLYLSHSSRVFFNNT